MKISDIRRCCTLVSCAVSACSRDVQWETYKLRIEFCQAWLPSVVKYQHGIYHGELAVMLWRWIYVDRPRDCGESEERTGPSFLEMETSSLLSTLSQSSPHPRVNTSLSTCINYYEIFIKIRSTGCSPCIQRFSSHQGTCPWRHR